MADDRMVVVPAGSFEMGNAVNPGDGDIIELPLHTVHVSAFYVDKFEVTKALWDNVPAWGLTHGYTDLAEGSVIPGGTSSSKGTAHPVHWVTWYEMLKWCNARSEMEGLTPVYYTDDAQTTLYRTGSIDVTNAQVKWAANGYRLPTEAEWEKAVGKRLPAGLRRYLDKVRA